VSLTKTCELLQQRVRDYYPELAGEVAVSEALPLRERSTYPIFLVEVRDRNAVRKVVIKFAPVFSENNEGLTEYRNMVSLKQRAPTDDPELGLVRALDFYPETNALVTEFVQGRRFSNELLAECSLGAGAESKQALRRHARAAGRWLAMFHGAGLASDSANVATLADSSLLFTCSVFAAQVRRLGVLGRTLDEVSRFLDWLGPHLGRLPGSKAPVHGDYAPQNMVIGDGRLFVFDLQRSYAEVIYHDIAYFLVTLETLNPFPKHPLFVRARALQLRGDFLLGYFGRPLEESEESAIGVLYVRNLLQRALKQHRSLSSRIPAAASRLAVQLRYPALLRREIKALRTSLG
jgi:tRNA A-37 threonylcarbamoyl transferase component Bud32